MLDDAEFELENKLANDPIILGQLERPFDRQIAPIHCLLILLQGHFVLLMNAVEIAEGRHAESQHVIATPEVILIAKSIARGILDSIVGANESVACLFQCSESLS